MVDAAAWSLSVFHAGSSQPLHGYSAGLESAWFVGLALGSRVVGFPLIGGRSGVVPDVLGVGLGLGELGRVRVGMGLIWEGCCNARTCVLLGFR